MFIRAALAGLAAVVAQVLPASAQGQLTMLCAPQAEWCEAIAAAFQRDTGIRVLMTRKSTGEILAQLRAESANPRTDIWFGGSAETHFSAAEENLLQAYTSPNMAALHPWARKVHEQSRERCVGVSTGAIGFAFNTEIGARKNLPAPRRWADLVDPRYRGEIQMPNPNSSGTAYTIIAGLVQIMGEDPAFAYLAKLHANINAYTRSGAAPLQAVARGETFLAPTFNMETQTQVAAGFPVAMTYPEEGTSYEVACMSIIRGSRNIANARRFYDWYLTPAAMDVMLRANQFHVPAHPGATADPRIPNMSEIKLIDYDIATFGTSAVRRRLIERWEREIGARPR